VSKIEVQYKGLTAAMVLWSCVCTLYCVSDMLS